MRPRGKRVPYSWGSVERALSHHTAKGALARWERTSYGGAPRVTVVFVETVEPQLLTLREAWCLAIGLARGERHYGTEDLR
jgi:hypothetical protein